MLLLEHIQQFVNVSGFYNINVLDYISIQTIRVSRDGMVYTHTVQPYSYGQTI